ncbi:MAG: hypothetical protein ACPGXL_04330 [Chitinophagales bacterium]
MKRKDSLFRLVKSLSKSEKRFFKIYSTRHVIGDQNNYVALFNAIARQTVYNEEAIVRKFKNHKFTKRLAVAKAYLYELILKSMNSYHAQDSVDAQLREIIGNIVFLNQKKLFNQAMLLVAKAKKTALACERLAIMPEILRLEKKVLEDALYLNHSANTLRELNQQSVHLHQQLAIINEYWLLQAQLNNHLQAKGLNIKVVDVPRRVENELRQLNQKYEPEQNLPFEAQLLLQKTYATYYFITRDFGECYQYSKKLVQLLESYPNWLNLELPTYIRTINNLLNISQNQEERKKYLKALATMQENKALKKQENVQIQLFEAYHYHLMTNCIKLGDYEKGKQVVVDLAEGLQRFKDKISLSSQAMLCFYGFHICFGAKKHEQAHQWLQKIVRLEAYQVRADIYHYAHLLLVVAAYEFKNAKQLKKSIKKTYKYLCQSKEQNSYHLNKMTLKFLKILATKPTLADLLPHLEEVNLQLIHMKENPEMKRVFAYFDFSFWLGEKLQELRAKL